MENEKNDRAEREERERQAKKKGRMKERLHTYS